MDFDQIRKARRLATFSGILKTLMPYYVRAPTDIPTDLSTEIVDTFTACRALHPFADRPSTSILKLNGSRYRLKMNEMQKTYERPAWLKRVQNHGLTPAGLEEYLKAGYAHHEIGPYIPGLNFSDFCLHQYGDSNDRTFDILGQPSQGY